MSLLGTLTSGVSALKTFSNSLEVIGNNIANVNTTGYKSQSTSFADTFSNTVRSASPSEGAIQIGTGVEVDGVNTNYKQGSLSSTGNVTDLAVSGNGYFMVKDAAGATYATRDGSFHFDTSGNLLNAQNMSVLDKSGAAIAVTGQDSGGASIPFSQLASVSIGSDGTVTAFASDGTSYAGPAATPFQIGLLGVADESKLMKVGTDLYDFGATGATIAANGGNAATNGLGKIQSGELELSNVDLTEQFSDLITSQRSFQAASRVITVSDSVLEEVVNLKR